MTCNNYGCANIPTFGFLCCDSHCGYLHKGNLSLIRKFNEGIITRKDLKDGLFDTWDEGKINYYQQLYARQYSK